MGVNSSRSLAQRMLSHYDEVVDGPRPPLLQDITFIHELQSVLRSLSATERQQLSALIQNEPQTPAIPSSLAESTLRSLASLPTSPREILPNPILTPRHEIEQNRTYNSVSGEHEAKHPKRTTEFKLRPVLEQLQKQGRIQLPAVVQSSKTRWISNPLSFFRLFEINVKSPGHYPQVLAGCLQASQSSKSSEEEIKLNKRFLLVCVSRLNKVLNELGVKLQGVFTEHQISRWKTWSSGGNRYDSYIREFNNPDVLLVLPTFISKTAWEQVIPEGNCAERNTVITSLKDHGIIEAASSCEGVAGKILDSMATMGSRWITHAIKGRACLLVPLQTREVSGLVEFTDSYWDTAPFVIDIAYCSQIICS